DWKPAVAPLMTRWAKDVRPDKVHPEYPRPQMVREKWQNLNGLWQFAEAKVGEAPPIGKNLDGRILVPFPVESALSGVGKRMERLWYRRTFTIPKDWEDRTVLNFGAVEWEATVWVDGTKLGDHRGGYDHFTFDITDALKKGEGEHELIVGVFDPSDAGYQPRGKQVRKPEGIWYTPSTGIWQTVWLEPVQKTYISSLRIIPDLSTKTARFWVQFNGPKPDKLFVGASISASGKFLRAWLPRVRDDNNTVAFEWTIEDEFFHLWSPESPFLYDLTLNLGADFKGSDQVKTYFGM